MILVDLRVNGFGKLVGCGIAFDRALNIVHGPNEAGKSTLTAALLASLYGLGRGERQRWRPWSGAPFATTLRYELADGSSFEVQRDFERDQRGIRVYDEHGNDASAACATGKAVSPGDAHLGVPVEVFVNASFVAQGGVTIDVARAERITHALARALDGGPKEDAALGALERLERALADHVGKKRATVHAPLRRIQGELFEARSDADAVRAGLRSLDELRGRLEHERVRSTTLEAASREHERLGRALRAHGLGARLAALREARDDLAALQAERAAYDDVEGFPSHVVAELDERYREWYASEAFARARAEEAARVRLSPALAAELDERRSDGGALDDAAFTALESAGVTATAARDTAIVAADRVQRARRAAEGGGELFGAAFTAAAVVAAVAAGLAVAHDEVLAALAAGLALVIAAFAAVRWSRRRSNLASIAQLERAADAAVAAERDAAAAVANVLGPLGVASIEELAKRRERARELSERKAAAQEAVARASAARRDANAAAEAFDSLARRLVVPSDDRARDLAAAKERDARKTARDGIDLRLSMLAVRRNDLLGTDDEFALEDELADLLASGVDPAPAAGIAPRAFEAERADLERQAAESREALAALGAEMRASEERIGDLAAFDERVLHLTNEVERLERFEGAVSLARTTIEARTREAHELFARRLADYASDSFARVTGGRYADLRVDPTTLAVNVRVPETNAIVDVELLSAGTREQAYLVVRLAMARMLAEGLEPAPLLLDDPFAFWDEARIERSFPILEAAARGGQIVLFTTSRELAAAAAQRGAHTIDLDASAVAHGNVVALPLDGNQDLPLLAQP